VLRITNVDPLRYGLIFERFLNWSAGRCPTSISTSTIAAATASSSTSPASTGRTGWPSHHLRDDAARAAIRDVGRVLEVPLPDVDRLAKLVPATVGITLDRALNEARDLHDLYESEPWARSVIDIARRLEGISRNASTHARGW